MLDQLTALGSRLAFAHLFAHPTIMLGSARDDEHGRLQRLPAELGGATQGVYVVVDSADRLHAKATAAGAEVILPLVDHDYGGRGFSCRDPEGHIWSFGTYDPWAPAQGH